jgi:hypothetical protein
MAAKTRPEKVADPQTGKEFCLEDEGPFDIFAASFAALYLIATLGFLGWLLFDTWAGSNFLVERVGYSEDVVTSDTYRLIVFVAIAGALGGTVAGIRSVVHWHAENKAYGARFIWRDLARPWVGATLGTLVYVSIRGGVGVINGDFTLDDASGITAFSAFAIAAVSGFSSPQVYKWLDDKADKLLSFVKPDKVSQNDDTPRGPGPQVKPDEKDVATGTNKNSPQSANSWLSVVLAAGIVFVAAAAALRYLRRARS